MLLREIDALYAKHISTNTDDYDGSQKKEEFAECIEYLDRRISEIAETDLWFLEIGAYRGLWALAFKVLCEKHGKTPNYATVTWIDDNPENNKDLFRVQKYYESEGLFFGIVDGDSTSPESLARVTKMQDAYQFVFIDADHTFEAVTKDIQNYAALATHILMFHDINTKSFQSKPCGVSKAIEKSGIPLNLRISYDNVMGIGIHNRTVATIPPPRRSIASRVLGRVRASLQN